LYVSVVLCNKKVLAYVEYGAVDREQLWYSSTHKNKRNALNFTQDKMELRCSPWRVSAGLDHREGELVQYKVRISSCTLRTSTIS